MEYNANHGLQIVADTNNHSPQMQQDASPNSQHSEARIARLLCPARFSRSVETQSSTARTFVLLLRD